MRRKCSTCARSQASSNIMLTCLWPFPGWRWVMSVHSIRSSLVVAPRSCYTVLPAALVATGCLRSDPPVQCPFCEIQTGWCEVAKMKWCHLNFSISLVGMFHWADLRDQIRHYAQLVVPDRDPTSTTLSRMPVLWHNCIRKRHYTLLHVGSISGGH